MPTGYRLELASSNRAACNGQLPCKGTKIMKGELRLGTWVEFKDSGSFKWRHWGCTTEKVIKNLLDTMERAENIDGYEDIPEDLQEKVSRALEVGHVDPADIPESAKKPKEEDEDGEAGPESSPVKKKPAAKKTKAAKAEASSDAEEEKPKKIEAKGGRGKKVKEEDGEDEVEEKPKAKRGRPKKVKEEVKEQEDVEEEKPKPKKSRKAKPDPEPESDDESELSEEEEKPAKSKAKAGAKRGKVVKEEEDVKPASKRAKPDSKAKKPASGKKAKKAPVDEDEDSE